MNALIDYRQRIVQEHEAAAGAMRGAIEHAVRAGQILLEAKATIPHGEFGTFCRGLPFAATTLRGYMRLAGLDPAFRQRVAEMPLRQALVEIAEPRPAPPRGRPKRGKKADALRAELAAYAARHRVSEVCARAKRTLVKVVAQPTFSDDERQAIDGLRAAIEACEAQLGGAKGASDGRT